MGMFDGDPAYDGPLDQDLNKVDPNSREAQILDALRRTGG